MLERANHWMTALSFIMLALTGIVLSVGVTLFQPFGDRVLGLAGWISTWGHTIFAPSFALGILVMAVLWLRQNLPTRLDLHWLARFGDFLAVRIPRRQPVDSMLAKSSSSGQRS